MSSSASDRPSPQPSPVERALAHVAALAEGDPLDPSLRVNIHFHPDRLFQGEPLLAVMARDGIYRSQFETGTSNGGLTAFRDGDRWKWESRIFGQAYDDAPPQARPKYGALNFRRRALGASPRFGSSYFRLASHTLARTTFCFPDSFYEPANFGVAHRMSLIALASATTSDVLDDYIEAQLHGPLRLDADVEALVLDPSFQHAPLEELARQLPCPIEWHPGFCLQPEALTANPDFRGPQYVALGLTLANGQPLTPRLLGDAARTGLYEEQALKRVWHYIARFGGRSIGP